MRFAIFDNLGVPGRLDPYGELRAAAREFARAADEAGFWPISPTPVRRPGRAWSSRPGTIVPVLAGSSGARPNARIGDRTTDTAIIAMKGPPA